MNQEQEIIKQSRRVNFNKNQLQNWGLKLIFNPLQTKKNTVKFYKYTSISINRFLKAHPDYEVKYMEKGFEFVLKVDEKKEIEIEKEVDEKKEIEIEKEVISIDKFKNVALFREAIDLYYRFQDKHLTNLSRCNKERLILITKKRNIDLIELSKYYNMAIDRDYEYFDEKKRDKLYIKIDEKILKKSDFK